MPNKSNRNNGVSDRNGRNGKNGKNGRTGQTPPNGAQRRTRAVPKNERRDDERLRYINQIGGISGGGAGVISGRAAYANVGGYSERARRESERNRGQVDRKRETFPNRRRKIITGKDLTTPLKGRAKVKGKALENKHEKVKVNVRIVHIKKERLPWLTIGKAFVASFAICMLIYSYIVLFDIDSSINRTRNDIATERITTQALERQYQTENDPTEILRFAREELGMVEERLIQKHHISLRNENRAAVIQEESNRLSNILSVVFRRN